MSKLIQASDQQCCEDKCKDKAVAFWPVMDPDIPSHPYCRKCLNKAKFSLMKKLWKL